MILVNLLIRHIIRKWKREANIKYDVFWGYGTHPGQIVICTVRPWELVGIGGVLYQKYIKELTDRCKVDDIVFYEIDVKPIK